MAGKILLVLALFASFAFADEAETPLGDLIVSKSLDTLYWVEGRNLTVKYYVHNIGEGVAYDVSVTDITFLDNENFKLIDGELKGHFDEIPSGENKTHSFVVIPAAAGEFKDISGTGDYRRSKGATLTPFQSSFLGTFTILSEAEYQADYADHTIAWVLFSALSFAVSAGPLALHYYIIPNKKVINKLDSKSS